MKVLALDIATNTGIAVGTPGSNPKCWSENLGAPPNARRGSNALRLTQRLILEHQPDFIAIEAAIGGKQANAYLIGLVANVEAVAYNRGVKSDRFHSGSVRKHFIGKAYTTRDFPGLSPAKAKLAIKQLVVDRCELLKWSVPNHDAADAAALWDYVCATRVKGYQSKPSGGLF